MTETKKQRYTKLLQQLKLERGSFESHWREIANFIKPRRLRLTRADVNRGDKRNQNIIDSTATRAAATLRAGMMAGMTSPSRPWFRLGTQDSELAKYGPVKNWLEQVRSIMSSALLKSNFYHQMPLVYGDAGVFGTGAIGMLEDANDVFRFNAFPLGEYWIANDDKLRTRVFLREFKMSTRQIVMRFGKTNGATIDWSNISAQVKNAWDQGNYENWFDVCHVVQPNGDHNPSYLEAKYKPFTDCYFEIGKDYANDVFLSEKGFDEFPMMVPRWEVAAGDVYGTDCPGMTALGDVKQLQMGEKVGMSALDKMVRPPMIAPTAFRSSKLSQLPGEVSYADEAQNATIRPMIDTSSFRVDLLEGKQDRVRESIEEAFNTPLFRMLSNMDVKDVTATAIAELKEEKLILLGPVYGQFDQDLLKPVIDREFAMLHRAGLLPDAPPELQGQALEVEYISAMAAAMKAQGRSGVDAFTGYTLEWAKAKPDVLDKIDTDQIIETYADMTGVPPNCIVPTDKAQQARDARNQAAAAQQNAETMATTADAAKDLSAANLTGDNALAALVGQGAGAGAVG